MLAIHPVWGSSWGLLILHREAVRGEMLVEFRTTVSCQNDSRSNGLLLSKAIPPYFSIAQLIATARKHKDRIQCRCFLFSSPACHSHRVPVFGVRVTACASPHHTSSKATPSTEQITSPKAPGLNKVVSRHWNVMLHPLLGGAVLASHSLRVSWPWNGAVPWSWTAARNMDARPDGNRQPGRSVEDSSISKIDNP